MKKAKPNGASAARLRRESRLQISFLQLSYQSSLHHCTILDTVPRIPGFCLAAFDFFLETHFQKLGQGIMRSKSGGSKSPSTEEDFAQWPALEPHSVRFTPDG